MVLNVIMYSTKKLKMDLKLKLMPIQLEKTKDRMTNLMGRGASECPPLPPATNEILGGGKIVVRGSPPHEAPLPAPLLLLPSFGCCLASVR